MAQKNEKISSKEIIYVFFCAVFSSVIFGSSVYFALVAANVTYLSVVVYYIVFASFFCNFLLKSEKKILSLLKYLVSLVLSYLCIVYFLTNFLPKAENYFSSVYPHSQINPATDTLAYDIILISLFLSFIASFVISLFIKRM